MTARPEITRTTRPTIGDGMVVDYRFHAVHVSASRNGVCVEADMLRQPWQFDSLRDLIAQAENDALALRRDPHCFNAERP